MPLETGTTISELDSSWPLSGDLLPAGDDHLRLIKAVLKAQFPGAGAQGYNTAILATEDDLNNLTGTTGNIQTQIDDEITARSDADTAIEARLDALEAIDHNNNAFPVGSVFFTSGNTNPGTLLGVGTWTQVSQGRFIVGVGTGTDANTDTRAYAAGDDGFGEYQHTLTEAELASHAHNAFLQRDSSETSTGSTPIDIDSTENGLYKNNGLGSSLGQQMIQDTGGDQPHENSPPAFGLYVWQRTA